MKCPLLTYQAHAADGSAAPLYLDCLKNDCAWWNSDLDMCSVAVPGNLAAQQYMRAERAAERQAMREDR